MQTIGRFLKHWASLLEHQGVDAPRLSAEVLTARALGLTRLELLLRQQRLLEPCDVHKAEASLRRRANHEPLAYILEEKEFYGHVFRVSQDVLIPRPETERLIEVVRGYVSSIRSPWVFADVCTGSGIIGIILALVCPEARGILVDCSKGALAVASRNVRRHGLEHRLQLVCGDLASALATASLDLLLANPPYIPEQEGPDLEREVRDYEPDLALFSGANGLQAAQVLADQAQRVLKAGGRLIMELGFDQPARLQRLLASRNRIWTEQSVFQDLSHRDRVLALQKTVCETTHPVG